MSGTPTMEAAHSSPRAAEASRATHREDALRADTEENASSSDAPADRQSQSAGGTIPPPHARILPPPSSGADFFPLPEVQQAAQTSPETSSASGRAPARDSSASLEEAQALQRALLESLGLPQHGAQDLSYSTRSPASAKRTRAPGSARRQHHLDADAPAASHARSDGEEGDAEEGGRESSFVTADGLSVHPEESERILEEELAGVVAKALVVGEARPYLACLFNLRTVPGTKELDAGAREAAELCGSSAITVKDAYFCPKFRSFLLAGISRYNKRVASPALWIKKFVVVAGHISSRRAQAMSAVARANNYTKFAKAIRNLYTDRKSVV